MSSREFLQKRYNTWFAVVEVPKPLRALAGRKRFMRSLKTDSLATANRLKLPLVAEWKRQINLLERGKPDKFAVVRVKAQELRALIDGLPDVLEEDEQGREVNWKDYMTSEALETIKGVEESHGPDVARQMRAIVLDRASFVRDLQPLWIGEFVGTEQTKDQGAFAVKLFLEFAGEFTTVQSVTRKQAGEFIGRLLAEGLKSRRTVERYASSLSSFWRWLIRRGHLDSDVNPWRGHELGKKSKKATRRALPDAAIVKLLKARYDIPGQRKDRRYETVLPDVLRIALMTGMRLGEICELERTDVERRDDGLWFNLGEGKTEAAERSVPVHPLIIPIVERRLADGDQYLIANLVRGGRDKRRGHHVSKAYGRFRKAAGVGERWQDMHAIRHSFTGCMEGHGVPESTTKLLIGHARESLTYGHYSKGDRVNLREAVSKLDFGAEIVEAICQS
jgi:integrase